MDYKESDIIESYLRGDLSGNDLASFEDKMLTDPVFKDEVQYEQHIKDGISEHRKTELKSRLNAIDVVPEGYLIGVLGSNTAVKTIGALLAVGTLGYIAYLNIDSDMAFEANPNTTYISENIIPLEQEVPDIEVPEATSLDLIDIETEATIDLTLKPVRIEEAEETIVKEEEEFIPEVSLPNLTEVSSEEAISTGNTSIPVGSENDLSDENRTPLNIEMVNKKSETIKYKYFDGKLYLYGDFGNNPYEILEINGAKDRKIYVFFASNYYHITVTDNIRDLVKIDNKELLKELEILRNNKLQD